VSELRIYSENNPTVPLATFTHDADVLRELAAAGVRFEKWQASKPVQPGASQDEVIAAYRADIERLQREEGYRSVDVVSLAPDHPDRVALRAKFLNEHTHSEDEVRFFVAGRGQFSLHLGDRIFEILCVQGDLIGVPGGTRHWFDMSETPYFVAIRLFTNKDGWVGNFTGSDIAEKFPRLAAQAAA
jgi:1,2-dihydroxy-3-keto-5-methylthiopentene dioxygenase